MNFENFKKDLSKYPPSKTMFVALGNELRGDDYAGILFLNELKKLKEFGNSIFLNAGTNPENYLSQIISNEPEVIIIIDAVNVKTPGKISWLESEQIDMMAVSTHSFSIKLIEQYVYAFQHVDFKYLGISPFSTDYGNPPSQELYECIKDFFKYESTIV